MEVASVFLLGISHKKYFFQSTPEQCQFNVKQEIRYFGVCLVRNYDWVLIIIYNSDLRKIRLTISSCSLIKSAFM